MTVFNLVILCVIVLVTKPTNKVLFFTRLLVIVALVVNAVELHNLYFPTKED